ncbi:MAG TPA: hypothetical protein VFB67_02175 [Candidatus Polarisedimenticolaceae bacterium]|nr:hypothetical protein [Candidatus Polarisedimenticolaceae bacterium]
MRWTAAALLLAACLAASVVRGASSEYGITVRDGQAATFELPFTIEYAGAVTLEAEWTGPRLLFFGVEGPGRVSLARRSGPSPQRLDLRLEAASLARGPVEWKLTVKALPTRGEATGVIRITLPDSPEVVARREALLHPPPPPPPPPPAWSLPRAVPVGASPDLAKVFAAVESYRAAVVAPKDARIDDCKWQIPFLVYAAAVRDRLAGGGPRPDLPAGRYFRRIAEAIRVVDGLRASKDPVLAGPVPEDRDARRAWLIARYEQVRPIERMLDEVAEQLRSGHAPSLEDEAWLPRFNACLTACERYFDERVRLGGEAVAPNEELAAAQWDRILAAGRVFDALRSPVP